MTTSRRATRVPSAAAVLALTLMSAGSPAAPAAEPAKPAPAKAAPAAKPTVEEARRFVDQANERLLELNNRLQRAQWVAATYITDDTEKISSEYNEQSIAATTALALEARRFDGMTLPPDVARSLKLLKLALTLPAPNNPKERAELTEIAAWLEGTYGKGKWCPQGPDKDCLDINAVSKILAESRDPKEMLGAWKGWHAVGKPMRAKYQRFVTLSNQGAKELGFADTGAMWRSNYDMEPVQFAAEVDRLWSQVRPLYESLHAYVRWKLSEKYGPAVVPPTGPIPAHVLGNLWAQTWEYFKLIHIFLASGPRFHIFTCQILKMGARV